MATRVRTGVLQGLEGMEVMAEVDLSRGLPGFHLVGLPNTEVRESRDRVLSGLRNSGVRVPPARITVNLAPAGVRKEGASCDLAMAVGIVAAARARKGRALDPVRLNALFLGELSLFGEIRPVRGLLPILLSLARVPGAVAVVPACQVYEANLCPGVKIVPVATLLEALTWIQFGNRPQIHLEAPSEDPRPAERRRQAMSQLAGLTGQPLARKAAVIAACGRHNLLLVGPPGSGKTRLARLLGDLQPDLDEAASLEATRIRSAFTGAPVSRLVRRPPFRAPHHSTSRAGLGGGGTRPTPGEVTLAHAGILFLDELPEFSTGVLEILRQPMEEGRIDLVRSGGRWSYPADFQLVAAMNPCRCGYLGSGVRECRCTAADRAAYGRRLSGPLLDRFDMFVEMGSWAGEFLVPQGQTASPGGTGWRDSPTLATLTNARSRLRGQGAVRLDDSGRELLENLRPRLGLSLRAVLRCGRVAATIAALEGKDRASEAQVREALEFRMDSLVQVGPGQGPGP